MKKVTFSNGHLLSLFWIITLVCLPLTSFPAFARLTQSIIAPFSTLPLLILLLVWFIPYILGGGELPIESKPLILFPMIAIASCAHAFFIQIPEVNNVKILGQEIRALVSLGIGLTFYLVFSTWMKRSDQLEKSLQWIHIGGALLVIWTLLQAYFIFWHNANFPGWMVRVQDWLVVRSPVFSLGMRRVIGLTYEPAWYAHLLVLFYLPLWFAASYERKSVFRFHFLGLSIENILLVVGLGEFFMCSPRVSLLSILVIILILFIRINMKIYGKLITQLEFSKLPRLDSSRWIKFSLRTISSGLFIAIYAVFFTAVIYLMSLRDLRLALVTQNIPSLVELKDMMSLKESTILEIGNRLAFLERAATWIYGWRVFNLFPWLGVGLGNAGFFAREQMPFLGWSSAEIRTLLNDPNVLPNIKNLWLRIMAETGIVGFSTILVWIYILWRSTRLSYHSVQPVQKVIAFAGELFLAVLIVEGFNVDYYAMPYFWVFAGLISANGLIYRTQVRIKEQEGELLIR
jgi:hypothetical protein